MRTGDRVPAANDPLNGVGVYVSLGVRRCAGAQMANRVVQNCVTYPLKPQSNTVSYGDTPAHIDVAESRWWELR